MTHMRIKESGEQSPAMAPPYWRHTAGPNRDRAHPFATAKIDTIGTRRAHQRGRHEEHGGGEDDADEERGRGSRRGA